METNTDKMVDITDRMDHVASDMKQDVSGMRTQTEKVTEGVEKMKTEIQSVREQLNSTNRSLDKLQSQLGGVGSDMGGLRVGIEEVYDGLRQGDSSSSRRASFDSLIKAQSHEKKLSEASLYVSGFEYYFWRDFGLDSLESRRDILVFRSVQQFFKDVFEIYNFKPSVFAFADPSINDYYNKEATFNVLASVIHLDNPKQIENIKLMKEKGIDIPRLTINSLIESAIRAKFDMESGKKSLDDLKSYEKEILSNYDVAVKLLQARWNFITVACLDKSFVVKNGGTYTKYFRAAWKLMQTWELDFTKLNSAQIEEVRVNLIQAVQTRKFLDSVGIPTKTDFFLHLFILRMKPVLGSSMLPADETKAQEILKYLEYLNS